MCLGVISDTHGDLSAWRRALDVFGAVEQLIHAGDVLSSADDPLAAALRSSPILLRVVRGNTDSSVLSRLIGWPVQPFLQMRWHGRVITEAHGDDFTDFRARSLALRANLAITGHTHVASIIRERGTIFLNPGSAALPKGRDPASVAVVSDEGVEILTLSGSRLAFEGWGPER